MAVPVMPVCLYYFIWPYCVMLAFAGGRGSLRHPREKEEENAL